MLLNGLVKAQLSIFYTIVVSFIHILA